MFFYRYPDWSGDIRNHYWLLRYARPYDRARIRREYRYIAKEKKRLQLAGVDSELLRLLCRHLVNDRNRHAEARWWAAYAKYQPKNSAN